MDAADVGEHATDSDSVRSETPELALVAAVLARGIADARAGRGDAVAWLTSDETSAGATGWTYSDACSLLDLDPSWGRAQAARGVQGPGRLAMRRTRQLRAAA